MKKALMFYGGWEGHEPKQCVDIFAPFLESQGFAVELADSLDVLADKERMAELSLAVPCWTMGRLEKEQSQGLRDAVMAGTGLAGWHGGMADAFRGDTEYQFMVGGQFICHPGGIIDYQVDITADDPVVADIPSFRMKSEQYYMHVDPSNQVLATTTFSGLHAGVDWIKGCVMPQIWKRAYGQGRVFYCAPGHVAADFQVEELKTIVQRGLLWAAATEK